MVYSIYLSDNDNIMKEKEKTDFNIENKLCVAVKCAGLADIISITYLFIFFSQKFF